jgi:hypothetical protein
VRKIKKNQKFVYQIPSEAIKESAGCGMENPQEVFNGLY